VSDAGASDPIAERALAAVAATGAPYDVVTIDPALADTAAFCEHYGYGLDVSAKCRLVASRAAPPAVAACLVLATTRLDVNRTVRRLMGVKKLSFAPAELTLERTGMQLGGVTPFGLDASIPLYVDARVMACERVIVGGGSRSVKLLVAPAALTAIGAQVVEGLANEIDAAAG
jgi:prolyl-tRNA editing enzyme YbaK/EbsC (Cys-tRNA(Pro) deacylase)